MYLKIEELEIGKTYICNARNFTKGKWTGEVFEYERYKFGSIFTDHEYHYDEGSPYGTVKPIELLNNDIE